MAASLIKISEGYYSNAELEKLLTEERIVPEMSFTRCAQFLARDLLNARRERDAALKAIRDMHDAENLRTRERICNCGTRIASDRVECDACFECQPPRVLLCLGVCNRPKTHNYIGGKWQCVACKSPG